jgi:EAL domain-containing protein (putative c-di-GMP-specific phosphodiesterase class I)
VRVEALVRIQEDARVVPPEVFIDVAEETGLLVAIDEQVLSHAIAQATEWSRRLGTGTDFEGVSINVTGRHLSDSYFVEVIAAALADNALAPTSLALEVTERVLMEASNSAMDCLRTIRDTGVLVGLDDFGTGYSSLAYLRQFPLDFVKIDQSFVQHLALGPSEDLAIVTAIVELAHALGLSVVAEGVETEEQLRTLVRLGCDHAQGFLFAAAADPDEVTSVIERRAERAEP